MTARPVSRPGHDRADAGTRVLRVIARLNVGGPALQAITLTRTLEDEGFRTALVRGVEAKGEGTMDPLARRLGVRPVLLRSLRRDLSPWHDLRALLALRSLIRRHRPEVLHTHTAKAGALGRTAAALSGRRRPRMVVHTFHGHVLSGYFCARTARRFAAIERWLALRTDVLIAVSDEVRDDLLRLGIGRPEQIRVVPLGLDLTAFAGVAAEGAGAACGADLRRRLGVPADAPLVTLAARLVPIKRVDLFLAAAERVAAERADTWFCVAGDGELRERLRASAPARRLAGRLVWPGFVDPMSALCAASHVMALCSDSEGTPVSIIEALAAGRAVVATRVGGVPSVVRDGETGLVVRPGDPGALAEAILRLLGDAGLRERLGAAGRVEVTRRFALDRLTRDIAHLYRSGLDRSARPQDAPPKPSGWS